MRRTTMAVIGAFGTVVVVGVASGPPVAALPARAGALVHPPVAASAATAASGGEHADAYADPGVLPFGDATSYGAPTNGPTLASPVVAMARSADGKGYWLAGADGGVYGYGDAPFLGSAGAVDLNAPVVGMAATSSGSGYWEVAIDGGVFTYGDARFFGSTGAMTLNEPIVGMAPTPDRLGYWLVASDGGVFAFGDAGFFGSTGAIKLNSPVVGMAATPDGAGYWMVAADGGIFSFGDAAYYGSTGGQTIPASIAGMATTADGQGYWLAGSDGSIFPFGDATSLGDNTSATPTQPIAGIVATPDAKGYWLLEPDAFPTSFDHPGGGDRAVVAAVAGAVEGNPDTGQGSFCNPYGPCEPWCALFATWAWQQAGIPVPRYPFTGSIDGWAAANTALAPATATAQPGDLLLYGTGPQDASTSVHTGVVAQVWPDGAVVTVEGDAGPGPYGHYNVVINGPFLPTDSATYNGFPVYAIARS
ncbi:MAG TPA: CHAP domain-containing protein [Acidimicrobiales bacterium]|nr:CHAP domain-containing protein [Acidimicrobiales bacterium]